MLGVLLLFLKMWFKLRLRIKEFLKEIGVLNIGFFLNLIIMFYNVFLILRIAVYVGKEVR